MEGYYIQANYHFMPAFLANWSPKRFGEGSTFTAVIRYDRVNLNMDNKGENEENLEQISFGLNYRPVEDCVFKMSYQYMPMLLIQTPVSVFMTAHLSFQQRHISRSLPVGAFRANEGAPT